VGLVCDKHDIGGSGKYCGDKDAQPGAWAAVVTTATTMMHSPTAFHKAGVAATYATNHCDENDAQPDRFSQGRRGRDVRYARTIINAHYVS
jgi:hypothetical protein